jgi:ATP-binding cassette, subfamily B, bacterial HlyB/CyaB
MAEQTNPWIAHWQGEHYVVVYQIRNKRVIVADPALGRRSISEREFQRHWTGYGLLLDPTRQLHSTEIQQASLGRYLNALLPYRSTIFQIILFSVLIQVFGLVTPLFTQIILDRVVVQKSLTTLNVFSVGLLLFGIWSIALSSVRQYLLAYFSNRLDLTLISGFINYTLMLPLKFFETRRVGDIITRVQENQKIQRFLIQQVVLAWLNFLTGFVYLGLMLYYNWQLTLLVLLLIVPILLLTLGATPLLRRVSREIFKEVADQNSVLVEMLTGVSTIKAAAAEKETRWRWEDHLTRQINAQFRGQKLGIRLQAASGLINSIGGTALLWFGASLVIRDQLTIGQFVAFNMMMGYVISPVLALANLWDELQEVLISVERLNDVFEATPEESGQQARLVLPPLRGEVQFTDVTFRYGEEEEQNTLQNLSFHVQPGQTVAIVGRSGSGKTTLVKLLEGLYHPNHGRVIVDGHDLRHVSPPSLRSQLGVVPQECFLFSGTILDNITLYRAEFGLEQVIEVAKLAEAHAFIQAMPLGYNTKVGERGCSLSGGQRQRIAIARALLGDPTILILDEATSSLDTESERRFQQNLTQIRRDRTTFVIAHRLSTVRNANQILVLDRGVLVEQGTHAELLAVQGLYYHLAQQQLDL